MFDYFKVYLFKDLKALCRISKKYSRMCEGLGIPVVDKVNLKKLYIAILTIESLKRPTIMLYPEYAIFFIRKLFNKGVCMSLGDAQILTKKYLSRKESIRKGLELLKIYYDNAVLFSNNGSASEIIYYAAYFYNAAQQYAWNVLNLYMLLCGEEVRRNTKPYSEPSLKECLKRYREEAKIPDEIVKKYRSVMNFEDIKNMAGHEMSFEEMKKIYFAIFPISPYNAKRYDNKIPFPDNWVFFRYFPFP